MKTILGLIAVVLLAGCSHEAEKQLEQVKKENLGLRDMVEQYRKTTENLQFNLQTTEATLSNYVQRVEVVTKRAEDAEKEVGRLVVEQKEEKPVVLPAMVADGTTVAKVLLKGGKVTAENVVFGKVFAGRVIFRKEGSAPLSYDVDSLDADFLRTLGIDAAAVKQAAAELERQRKDGDAKAYAAFLEKQKAQRAADSVWFTQQEAKQKQAAADAKVKQQEDYEKWMRERAMKANENLVETEKQKADAYKEYLRQRLQQ